MGEKLPLKERIKKEKEKFMKLDSAAKKRYFRDYYLLPCVLILLAIVAVIWFAADVFSSKKTIYSGATVGFNISDEGNEYLTSGFLESIGKSSRKKKVELSRDAVLESADGSAGDAMNIEMAFAAQITTGMFQYVIFTKDGFEHYSMYDFYLSLDEYKNSDKYSSLEFLETSDGSVCGILVPDNVKAKIGYEGTSDLVFTLVYSNSNKDLNPTFIDYLFLGGGQ